MTVEISSWRRYRNIFYRDVIGDARTKLLRRDTSRDDGRTLFPIDTSRDGRDVSRDDRRLPFHRDAGRDDRSNLLCRDENRDGHRIPFHRDTGRDNIRCTTVKMLS